jgi:CRISPR-associated endonuclease/helicase Cas3
MSAFPSFADFFRALWKNDPFPWQEMLANHVMNGDYRDGFPDAVDLPTASGKTACLDIAVYALAAQADALHGKRTAARRIWFVVDRRIVVDEAFERAEKLASALENPTDPVLQAVAKSLLKLRGLDSKRRPLAVGRLRGGVLRDDRWARIPSQAAIITSTVDQLGSRLLFRGYGHSALAAPIFAGLAGNDSLIFLDEAHCAVPFLQTLRAVQMFRKPKWSEVSNPTPFHVAVLSATPPGEDNGEKAELFPASEEERTQALNHQLLIDRLTAAKRAVFEKVKDDEKLAIELAKTAENFARDGTLRVGVIVNRVARATQIAEALRSKAREKIPDGEPPAFDVELLTGRIRSVERDAIVGKEAPLHRHLRAEKPEPLERPLILVSTQCLEVGADFSFDALVTECASLDALRQRFGRLARLGKPEISHAFIFVAESALKESDPIYGDALRATWEFLWNKAAAQPVGKGKEIRIVDFAFEALRALLPPPEELRPLLAPSPDAPVLLPAHLDLLCQTSPLPHPNPDIGIFLHGKGRGAAEVRVAFRCDLDPERPEDWAEIVSLCRPVASEMFSVPLHRFRAWLQNDDSTDTTGDVEGENDYSEASHSKRGHQSKFLLCRGREKSAASSNPADIHPNDVIIYPAPRDKEGVAAVRKLGQALCERGFGPQQLDVWELAMQSAGKTPMLRLHRQCLAPWLGVNGCPPLRTLLELVESGEWMADELREALAVIHEWKPDDESTPPLPEWLLKLFGETADFRVRDIAQHPGGGVLLCAKRQNPAADEPDYFADEDDAPSEAPEEVPLAGHCAHVAVIAEKLARACLGEPVARIAQAAGQWHDTGKLDLRFQDVLRGGAPDDGSEPLAKSPRKTRSREQANAIREAAGLPNDFRHEMLSAQLAERFCEDSFSPEESELLQHLIASHHGHARPFAPVCADDTPPTVAGQLADMDLRSLRRAAPRAYLHLTASTPASPTVSGRSSTVTAGGASPTTKPSCASPTGMRANIPIRFPKSLHSHERNHTSIQLDRLGRCQPAWVSRDPWHAHYSG